VRAEYLDWLLILNRRHLERVLRVYVDHYNRQRPHSAREHRAPKSPMSDEKDRRRARSAAATASAVSSTSTSEPPPDLGHE
jgi:hypothetical protein